jgi:class 3 adenylate cyclase
MPPESRQLSILFADLSGSVTLYERLGDRGALEVINSVIDLLKACVALQQGQVVKTIGDEVMAAFATSEAAARAAIVMQVRVAALAPFAGTRLFVRIGFHVGQVLEENADFFGDAVNTAARVAGVARGGQIMTTAATIDDLPPALRDATRRVAALSLKGKQSDVEVCELLWQGSDKMTLMAFNRGKPLVHAVLKLLHGSREITVDASRGSLQIGRDESLEIVLQDAFASRLHGRVEHRAGKFQYVDLSSNGTFVIIDADPEVVLRRESITLRGNGRIGFGHSTQDAGAEIVRFACSFSTPGMP